MEFKHLPVMLSECIEGLKIKDGGTYFDGTMGACGHTSEILRSGDVRVIATDLDTAAIENAKKVQAEFPGRLTCVHDNFKNFATISDEIGGEGYDGILLDLGVSSYQLDERKRGFSYMGKDEPLDMKMNPDGDFSAYDVVNGYSERELSRVLKDYGEERFHAKIAENIVNRRQIKKIVTCGELNEIIDRSIPAKFKKDGHPSKRTYQALRIEVNGELNGLYETIVAMGERLNKGGRLAVITFHSLEDRIVKNAYKYLESDCICDKSLPVCVCGKKKIVNVITAKPIVADEQELDRNPRAKSAKLRICERV